MPQAAAFGPQGIPVLHSKVTVPVLASKRLSVFGDTGMQLNTSPCIALSHSTLTHAEPLVA